MQFNRPYNYTPTPDQDVEFEPSQTIPNLSMSLNEILRRYTVGEPIPREIMGTPSYNYGSLSPMSKKGVGLEDWSDLKKANSEVIGQTLERARRESRKDDAKEEPQKSEQPPTATPET